jgi:flagellar motor switch protein FliN/FliY
MEPENKLSTMDIDAIGEIMNISMGSAATAISTMLEKKVTITTPTVEEVTASSIVIDEFDPAVGVSITYVEGISGNNILVLKIADVNAIVNIMTAGMMGQSPDSPMDEMSLSVICEVMNQMMGSSSTALSDFFGRTINISTPVPVDVTMGSAILPDSQPDDRAVTVAFRLEVEGVMSSKFLCVMTAQLVQEMLGILYDESGVNKENMDSLAQPLQVTPPAQAPAASEQTPAASVQTTPTPPDLSILAPALQQPQQPQQPIPVVAPLEQYTPGSQYAQQPQPQPQYAGQQPVYNQAQYAQPQQGYPQQGYPQQPQQQYAQPARVIMGAPAVDLSQARPVQLQSFDEFQPLLMETEQSENLDLLRSVPLEVTVEIGKAVRKVREILEFTQGTVLELDKQAGAQVDIIVNGQPIAKGDVVVIGDNFGVRITEILKRQDFLGLK